MNEKKAKELRRQIKEIFGKDAFTREREYEILYTGARVNTNPRSAYLRRKREYGQRGKG